MKKNKVISIKDKFILSFKESLDFIIGKKNDIENVLSYLIIFLMPYILFILGSIMVITRYIKIIFKKGE